MPQSIFTKPGKGKDRTFALSLQIPPEHQRKPLRQSFFSNKSPSPILGMSFFGYDMRNVTEVDEEEDMVMDGDATLRAD
jgi:hypothetical protein